MPRPEPVSATLLRIAETIESRPVMGYWPHMQAAEDAALLRRLAVWVDKLWEQLEKTKGPF